MLVCVLLECFNDVTTIMTSCCVLTTVYCISRNIDSDFNLAIWRLCKDCQINLSHYQLQAWVFLHAVTKHANFKSCQQHFLSKPPNIMFTYISVYVTDFVKFKAIKLIAFLATLCCVHSSTFIATTTQEQIISDQLWVASYKIRVYLSVCHG